MIRADLHLHTCCSHGLNTPFEMSVAAKNAGLSIIGFSEHSPRPAGFDYTHEYRESLARTLPDYFRQVMALKKLWSPENCLLGMEIDWLEGEEDFIRQACTAQDFDYLIGSVHFIGHWGFDDGAKPWLNASQLECEGRYEAYFRAWKQMLASGLFQIAAHPDLIKILSVRQFHTWLNKPASRKLVRDCLETLRDSGMAMEVSSAGLRKPCAEIYPAPEIMEIAAELGICISFASDAHNTADVGHAFQKLAGYARKFGFRHHYIFNHGQKTAFEF